MNGTKRDTEAAGSYSYKLQVVRLQVEKHETCQPGTCNYRSGRRALHTPAKRYGQRTVEVLQVIMPERVTIKRVRIPFAESLRFPGEGKSAQG